MQLLVTVLDLGLVVAIRGRDCRSVKRCSRRHVPVRALARVFVSALMLGWRSSASVSGSRSPARMASRMAIPVSPVISLITWWSCTFIWVSAFCMCCTWEEAIRTSEALWRSTVRTAATASGG
jgi:hypothetical protein